jgi:hypothetical protein
MFGRILCWSPLRGPDDSPPHSELTNRPVPNRDRKRAEVPRKTGRCADLMNVVESANSCFQVFAHGLLLAHSCHAAGNSRHSAPSQAHDGMIKYILWSSAILRVLGSPRKSPNERCVQSVVATISLLCFIEVLTRPCQPCYMCSMGSLNIRKVPDDVRRQFKSLCVAKGRTMAEVIIEFMRKEAEKGKPKK